MLTAPALVALGLLAGATTVSTNFAPTGLSPVAIAYDPGCGYIFTANSGAFPAAGVGSGLSYVNTATGVLTTIAQGQSIRALAVDAATNDVFLVDGSLSNAYVYSCSSTSGVTFVATFHTPCISNAVAWDPTSSEMWASCPATGFAYWMIDTPTPSVAGVIPVPGGTNALAFDPANHDMLVASTPVNTVSAIGSSGSNLNTIVWTKAVGTAPVALAFDSENSWMYVVNQAAGTVSALKSTGALAGTVTVGSVPVAASYNNVTGHVFVANLAAGTVTDILGTSVVATVTVGTSPIAISNDSATTNMYVLNSNSGTVSVVSPADVVVGSISVGANPTAAIYCPTTVNVWLISTNANQITELPTTVNTPALAAGGAPFALALAPGTGNMFVTLSGANAIEAIAPTNALVASTGLGGSCLPGGPTALAASTGGGDLFAVCTGSDFVQVVDQSDHVVAAINLATAFPGYVHPIAIAYDPYLSLAGCTGFMVVGSSTLAALAPICAATLAPAAATIATTAPTTATGLAFDWGVPNNLFVAEPATATVQAITTGGAALAPIGIAGPASQVAIQNGSTTAAWAPVPGVNTISVVSAAGTGASTNTVYAASAVSYLTFDVATGTMAASAPGTNSELFVAPVAPYGVVTTAALGAGTTPGPSAYNPVDTRVYVVETGTGNVAETLGTSTVFVTLPLFAVATPTGQSAIAYAGTPLGTVPAGNENMYYVTNGVAPPVIWDL